MNWLYPLAEVAFSCVTMPIAAAMLDHRLFTALDAAILHGAFRRPTDLKLYTQHKSEIVEITNEEASRLAELINAELNFMQDVYRMTFEAIDQRWDEAAVAGAVLRAQNVLLQQARERIAKRLGEVEHKRHRDRGLERGRKANQQTLQDRNKPEFDRLVDRAELFIKETGSDFSFLDDGRTAWPIIDPCREWRDRFGRGGGPRSRRSLTEDLRRVKAALLRRNPPSRIAG